MTGWNELCGEEESSVQQQVAFGPPSESDYQWLVEVLEELTSIVSRNTHNGFTTLAEADYKQLDAVLKELIYVVGDNEKHPLAPLMDFIGVLTTKYEDKHFPKLTDLFPELVKGVNPNDTRGEERKDNPIKVPEKPVNVFAAEAFFSIGSLLLEGGKKEGAISAYDQVIWLNPDYAEAYYYRGEAKCSLGQYKSASVDFGEAIRINPSDAYAYLRRASELAEQAGNQELRTEIEQSLQELANNP